MQLSDIESVNPRASGDDPRAEDAIKNSGE